ncbi:hypothetical protein QEZ52_18495 [Aliisedimentitalea scapharcae]|uniref:Uncharacterized protein n=1 Tax=Aliisedimentitalea scapharcae TaxID=1524259 RepID=A0ABZ2XT93_9RHOB|nr:hypothetical protein K3727_03930 [Rhodobacteraceae bacterium M382]
MRMSPLLFTLFGLLPASLLADSPIGAEEFDKYTRGKTLFYGFDGEPYGVERYLPGRRVIWSFLDGDCLEGSWYQDSDQICFLYEDRSDPQCWHFELGDQGLTARLQGDATSTDLYEGNEINAEMICHGPEVGV